MSNWRGMQRTKLIKFIIAADYDGGGGRPLGCVDNGDDIGTPQLYDPSRVVRDATSQLPMPPSRCIASHVGAVRGKTSRALVGSQLVLGSL